MEVDKSTANETQARNLAKKKRDAEIEEQRIQLELGRAAKERAKLVEAEREKGDKELVEISAAANAQMEGIKKMNTDRVKLLGDNTNKHYEDLAARTSEEIRLADQKAMDTIEAKKLSSMDKIKQVTDRSQDPFYQLKTLNPAFSESEKEFTVKVALPPHEAKNLFVSGEGQYLKLSLARRFQENSVNPESKKETKTNSYQSIVEQIPLPAAYESRKISRDYKDGVVTITVPKTDFTPRTKPS